MSSPKPKKSKRPALFLAIGSALFLALGTAMWLFLPDAPDLPSTPQSGLTEVQVVLKGQPITVELAQTRTQWQQGLMNRSYLEPGHGMLFVGQKSKPMSFWMKNTLIPLDILFFDKDWRLVGLHQDVPPCTTPTCPSYSSPLPAQHVLELNAGHAAKLGVNLWDTLEKPEAKNSAITTNK